MTTTTQVYTTSLCCPTCGTETEHLILYAGPYIKEMRCTVCGTTYSRQADSLRDEFVQDLPRRTRRFAQRGFHELHDHPVSFLTHLPQDLLVMSLGLCAELYAMVSKPSDHSRHQPQ